MISVPTAFLDKSLVGLFSVAATLLFLFFFVLLLSVLFFGRIPLLQAVAYFHNSSAIIGRIISRSML